MKTRFRRSLQVSLALIGAITFGCSREETRYTYKSLEDCQADWGSTEECEQRDTDDLRSDTGSSADWNETGVRRPGHIWLGPRLFPGRSTWNDNPRPTSSTGPRRHTGTTKITVGGFGGTGRHHVSIGG